ncbi:MAG: YafY family transcriptional regulator [Geodermatophilaceae bacterium]|nr:YafY family transcriptional regulator [Geodermatophilaceae bacterium]
MITTSARLLRLLGLLQQRQLWSGSDLAERLEITERTVRRDIERLRTLGYPVHAATGTGGGYRLGAGAALPPLLLDDEEAVAVAIGLRAEALGTIAGLGEASLRALTKLERVLPARLRHVVTTLHSATVPLTAAASTVDTELLLTIAAACRDSELLRFDYRTRDGADSNRRVEPHRLVNTGNRWYLVARDVERADWRTFRVDRISAVLATGRRVTLVDPPDAAAFVAAGVSSAPYRYQARVLLEVDLTTAAQLVPPTVGSLAAVEGGTVLSTGGDSLDGLALHLAFLGCDFEVLDPPELRARLDDLARRLATPATQTWPLPVGHRSHDRQAESVAIQPNGPDDLGVQPSRPRSSFAQAASSPR